VHRTAIRRPQRRPILLACVVALAPAVVVAQGAADSAAVHALLDSAYAHLRAERLAAAREAFARALARDPGNRTARLELGYLEGRRGRWMAALAHFEAAAAAHPGDSQIAEAIRVARANARVGGPPRTFVDAFAWPAYQTRFRDLLVHGEVRAHRRLSATGPVTAYVGATVSADTRSQGGTLPAIFSDNFALAGVGLAVQPGAGFVSLRAEAGAALNLIESAARPDPVELDARAVAAASRRWERPAGRGFWEVNASAGYYHRYDDNGILYATARGGRRLTAAARSPLYGYGRLGAAADINGDFYNNAAEAALGFEWRAGGPFNIAARAEVVGGRYLGVARTGPNPYADAYGDVRLIVLAGRRWVLGRGGAR
jgi:tetratricopeptide (TPR) repeat protein